MTGAGIAAARYRLYGANDPDVIAAGHSNVANLLMAIETGQAPAGLSAAVAYVADMSGGPPGDPSYWDYVVEQASGRTVLLVWAGNQVVADFLFRSDPPVRVWDDAVPSTASADAVWIPREMLRAHWDPTLEELSTVLSRLAQARAVYVLGTPPPKPNSIIRPRLANEAFFVTHARGLGFEVDDLQLTGESDRLAMWRVLQDMLRDRALDGGAQFVEVPNVVVGSDGLLLEQYTGTDVSHAGTEYGVQFWTELLPVLKGGNAGG